MWEISGGNREAETRGISAPVMMGVRLVLRLLLLSSAVIFSDQESAEVAPFHGFFPIRKIRADKPLADGRPNDIYYSLRPGPLRVPRGFTVHYPNLKFDFDVPKDPERAQYVIIPQQNLQRTGNKSGGHKGNKGFKGGALHVNQPTTPPIIRKHGAAVASSIPRFSNRGGLAAGPRQRQNIGGESSVDRVLNPVQFGQKSSSGTDGSAVKSIPTISNGQNTQRTATNQRPRFPDRTNQQKFLSSGLSESTNQRIVTNSVRNDQQHGSVLSSNQRQVHRQPTNQHHRPQGQQQPTNQRQQPPQGQQQPTNQRQRPLQGQQQPTNQRQRPLQGQQQPTNQRQRPLQGQQQPTNQRQQPPQGQQQPTNQRQRPIQGQQQQTNQRRQPLQGQQRFLTNQQQRRQQPANQQQTIPSSTNQQQRLPQPANHQRGFSQSQNQKQILPKRNQQRLPLQQQTNQQGFQQAANRQRGPQDSPNQQAGFQQSANEQRRTIVSANQQAGFQQPANQQRRPQDSADQQRRISSQLFRNVREPEQVDNDSSELLLAASRFPKEQVRFFPGGFVRQTSTSFTHFSG